MIDDLLVKSVAVCVSTLQYGMGMAMGDRRILVLDDDPDIVYKPFLYGEAVEALKVLS